MSSTPGGLGSDANAAFAKFASMDQFDLIPKASNANDAKDRDNPFEDVVSKAPAPTLAGMKMMSEMKGAKEEMKANPDVMSQPGALVLSGNQTGNWSAYSGLGSQAPGPMATQGYGQIPGSSGSVMSSISGMNQPTQSQGYGQPQQYYGMSNNVGDPTNVQSQQQQPQQYGFQQGYGRQPPPTQGYDQQSQTAQGYGYGAQQSH